MKVVCIKYFKSQGLQYELTYGKSYDLQPKKWDDDDIYFILCDKGFVSAYNKNSFITIEEWRDSRLKSLGI